MSKPPKGRTSRLIRAVTVLVAAAMVGGCASTSAAPVYRGPASCAVVTDDASVSHGSMVKKHHNAQELAEDSSLLVVGTVTKTEPATILNLAFARYTIAVESKLAGEADPEIAVYLLDEPGAHGLLDAPARFNDGQRYVLFLRPTGVTDTQGRDGYYVVGPGAWGETSGAEFTLWVDPAADSDIPQIPHSFSLGDAAELLSAVRVGAPD